MGGLDGLGGPKEKARLAGLDHSQVVVAVPGGEGFARACYATSMKDIGEALVRMERFLKSLKQ